MQYTVDAESRNAEFTRVEVNVTRALVERVLQQPVDDMNDVRIVGVHLAAELSPIVSKLEPAEVLPVFAAPRPVVRVEELGV